jgi:prepilin-type N-terminal cleavage/methylation domain-containing protein/prepilin-type processing-associated H-X9-DG protein
MRQRRHGFTLVELLVVIGIIALLISILMPALISARAQAKTVQELSNYKQIYNAVAFYANTNQGFLPYAGTDTQPVPSKGTWGASGTNASIYFELAQHMGYSNVDNQVWEARVPDIFRCNEFTGDQDYGAGVWCPWVMRTVRFNPRGFPGPDQYRANGAAGAEPMSGEWPQRKLSSVRDSASKIAFWECEVSVNWNMTAVPSAIRLDGWRWSWGHQYCDPAKADWDNNHLKDNLDPGRNREETGYFSGDGATVRFRHNNQTTTVVTFFDGHAEARKLTNTLDPNGNKLADIKVGEMCINRH